MAAQDELEPVRPADLWHRRGACSGQWCVVGLTVAVVALVMVAVPDGGFFADSLRHWLKEVPGLAH
jgi:hypothetical protein